MGGYNHRSVIFATQQSIAWLGQTDRVRRLPSFGSTVCVPVFGPEWQRGDRQTILEYMRPKTAVPRVRSLQRQCGIQLRDNCVAAHTAFVEKLRHYIMGGYV